MTRPLEPISLEDPPCNAPRPTTQPLTFIDPKQLADDATLDHLRSTADNYFKSLTDPTPWMTKPFSSVFEAPELLQNIGLLISGLRLGKTMTVLDFGAGSCWLSRILNQLQCQTISCDISQEALEIGKRLFKQSPPLGEALFQPRFLLFEGLHLDLPDDSVDRIVCHDAFHHVPNQRVILSEFARVLKPGGLAGFSEPGKDHSRKPQSQMEMKNYGVLENDIDLAAMAAFAREAGFSRVSCRMLNRLELGVEDYNTLTNGSTSNVRAGGWDRAALEELALADIRETMADRSIFFLFKGEFVPDSRGHDGLSHTIYIDKSEFEASPGEPLHVDATISNNGRALWLTENDYGIGVVNLGTHLYDENGSLMALDFSRTAFESNVLPGQKVHARASLNFPSRGRFTVAFDLVSDGVGWFEMMGSQPRCVNVHVK